MKRWLTAAWRYVRSAPLTYVWLTVLLVTTIVKHFLSRPELHDVLIDASTSWRHLLTEPVRVLFESLLWIDGRWWSPYLVLFTLFLAPAERWLGQIRWLTVGLTAHVLASYFSEGVLYLQVQQHHKLERLVHVPDIGVSYFLVGVITVLAYHVSTPWRWGYLAVLIIVFAVAQIIDPNFTAIGHFAAIFIGLSFYPMARGRGQPPVNPLQLFVVPKSG